MTVGVLTLEIAIYEAVSLKDKRRVIKGLKERLRQRFNVSVAEVDDADRHQRATIAVAMVSGDPAFVHGCFERIVQAVQRHPVAVLLDFDREIY